MRLQLSAWHQDFGDPWQALDYLRECLALEPKLGRSELSVGIVCNLNLLRLLAEDSVLQDHGASPALREHGGEAGLTLAHELTSVSAQCAAAQGNQEYSNGAWAKTLPVFQKRSPGSAQAKLCQAIFSAIRLAGLGQTVRASRLLSSFSGPLLSVGEGEAAASCRRVDALTIVSRQSVTEIGREALAYLSPKVPWISGYLDRRA